MHILVAEDDHKLNKLIVETLREAHFTPDPVYTAKEAEYCLKTNAYDLVILDWCFEGEDLDGVKIVQHMREHGNHTPTLILTGKSNLIDKVTGLKSGADDYLTKPFHLPELVARVHALLRRSQPASKQSRELSAGGVTLDTLAYTAKLRGKPLKLNNKEFQLLRFLLLKTGEVVTRTELLEKVWGDTEARTLSNTIDVHIRRLRVRLGRLGQAIHTIRGVGYRFDPK